MRGVNQYTKYFSKFFLGILVLVAIPLFLLNDGFYFADTKESLKVSYTESTEDEVKNLGPVSNIDRENSFVYFQNYNLEQITQKIEQINENEDLEDVSFVVISNLAEIEDVYINIFKISITLLLGFILIHLYRVYHKLESKIDYYSFIRLSASFIVLQITYLMATVGVLGIISRFYKITINDIYLTVIVEILLFMILNYIVSTNNNLNFVSYKQNVNSWVKENRRFSALIAIMLLFPLFFGLGINFVIPGLLILCFLTISLELIIELIKIEDVTNHKVKQKITRKSSGLAKNTAKTKRGSKNWKNRFNKKRK